MPTIRQARHVTDRLVVVGRLLEWTPLTGYLGGMSKSLWWVQLSEQPTWLVQVVDEAGELMGGGIEREDDRIDALRAWRSTYCPSNAGPMLLTVTDRPARCLPSRSRPALRAAGWITEAGFDPLSWWSLCSSCKDDITRPFFSSQPTPCRQPHRQCGQTR